jgi:CheY-like chemotaxis protein
MLLQWHMRPTTVDGGRAAVGCMMHAAGNGGPFPLVLIDAHMPETDGFALVERIQHIPELAGATIMMLSSVNLSGEAARCRTLGVAAYVAKPIRQSELLDAMLVALGNTTCAAPRTAIQPPLEPSVRRLHILLAEDNLVNQRLAARMLEKRGHAVAVANNGREALAALAQEHFDVVLMDVQMPEMDGIEATAAIREFEKTTGGHVPIIAVTAHALKGDEQRCLAAGMDRYLAKPVRARDLLAVIEELTQIPAADLDAPTRRHVDAA